MSDAQLSAAEIERLESYLTGALDACRVQVTAHTQLGGGAIQENWAIDLHISGGPLAGEQALVLRTDSPTQIAVSLSRVEEYRLLSAAWEAGVTVPEPIHCCHDPEILGRPFCLMRRVAGTAIGQKITKDAKLGGDKEALTQRLGRELALIHKITPETHRFDFLAPPSAQPSVAELSRIRDHFDALARPRPVLEWAMRWLQARAPESSEIVLAHHDFRTGNYLVDEAGLNAILDWEFAGWSDPHEDIGWFTAMCWRFAGRDKPAGGIGSREAFYRGYRQESGRDISNESVYWWEVYAHLRWAVIALQQGERYLTGGEDTLVLGLTGRKTVEMEIELLRLTAPEPRS